MVFMIRKWYAGCNRRQKGGGGCCTAADWTWGHCQRWLWQPCQQPSTHWYVLLYLHQAPYAVNLNAAHIGVTSSRAVRFVVASFGASEQRSQASLHPHPSPPPLSDRLLDPGPTLTQRSSVCPEAGVEVDEEKLCFLAFTPTFAAIHVDVTSRAMLQRFFVACQESPYEVCSQLMLAQLIGPSGLSPEACPTQVIATQLPWDRALL